MRILKSLWAFACVLGVGCDSGGGVPFDPTAVHATAAFEVFDDVGGSPSVCVAFDGGDPSCNGFVSVDRPGSYLASFQAAFSGPTFDTQAVTFESGPQMLIFAGNLGSSLDLVAFVVPWLPADDAAPGMRYLRLVGGSPEGSFDLVVTATGADPSTGTVVANDVTFGETSPFVAVNNAGDVVLVDATNDVELDRYELFADSGDVTFPHTYIASENCFTMRCETPELRRYASCPAFDYDEPAACSEAAYFDR